MRHILFTFLFLLIVNGLIISASGEIDLREANVTNATFTKLEGQDYNFAVTLFHDDQGEDGYADSWQVEKLDGTLLGTRILTHAHGTLEFTREQVITIPETVIVVVIRGHDQTHGFGGQALIVDLISGFTEIVDQGSEPMDFTNYPFTSNSVSSIHSTDDDNTSSDSLNFTSFTIVGILLVVGGIISRRFKK